MKIKTKASGSRIFEGIWNLANRIMATSSRFVPIGRTFIGHGQEYKVFLPLNKEYKEGAYCDTAWSIVKLGVVL